MSLEFHLFKWWSFSWCPDTVFCAGALVRNSDIRQRRVLLVTNQKECVLLEAQAGYTAQASGFDCLGRGKETFIQFDDALSLKKQAGFNPEQQNDGFLMGHPCRPPDMLCGERAPTLRVK